MRKRYKLEFLTRKLIVQAVYSNLCEWDDRLIENTVDHNSEPQSDVQEYDKALLGQVLEKVLSQWHDFSIAEYEQKGKISRCAQAILRAAAAEFDLVSTKHTIVIDEYVELSKMFCENETRMINKVLDSLWKTKSAIA